MPIRYKGEIIYKVKADSNFDPRHTYRIRGSKFESKAEIEKNSRLQTGNYFLLGDMRNRCTKRGSISAGAT